MGKTVFVVLALAVCTLTGCIAQAPNSIASAPPVDTRVTIAPDLWNAIQVTDVRCAPGDSSFLNFQANVVNNTDAQIVLEWRVQWLDADGIEIDSVVSTWNSRALQPFEICALKGRAPRSNAADMRFYVRRAK